MTQKTYAAKDLLTMATRLFERAGLPPDRAHATAEILVEGDLMGHSTHGLQLLGPYLGEIEKGTMTLSGDPEVLADQDIKSVTYRMETVLTDVLVGEISKWNEFFDELEGAVPSWFKKS